MIKNREKGQKMTKMKEKKLLKNQQKQTGKNNIKK